jgi:membrane protease YdiL (CAAX protease family)
MLSRKPWLPEVVMMFIGAIVLGACVTNLAALALHSAHVPGFRQPDDIGFLLCATLGMQGLALVLIPIFLRMNETTLRTAFGLDQPDWPKSILLAAGLVIIVLPAIESLQFCSQWLLEKLHVQTETEAAVQMFLNETTFAGRCYMVVFAVILAPVAEEFIFRGVLYPFIKQFGWPRAAFFGVSALFAGIHFDLTALIPLFILAVFLTWLYEKTNCLLASITVHSLFNAANVVLLFLAPQVSDTLQKTGHAPLPQ